MARAGVAALGGLILSAFAAATALAGPAPGSYELYDDKGQLAGSVEVTLSTSIFNGLPVSTLESVTTVATRNMLGAYRMVQRDTVVVSTFGALSFSREAEENGKTSYVRAERQGTELLIRAERNGRKLGFSQPVASFDMVELETELSSSPFRRLTAGQSRAARVFYLEELKPLLTTRQVSRFDDAEFGDRRLTVLAARSTAYGKTTTIWFDAATGDLLQEEGQGYLLQRKIR